MSSKSSAPAKGIPRGKLLLFFVVALSLGGVEAHRVNRRLDIQIHEKRLPKVPPIPPVKQTALKPFSSPIVAVVLDKSRQGDELYARAIAALREAVAYRGKRPALVEQAPREGRCIAIGASSGAMSSKEAFAWKAHATEKTRILVLSGGSRLGAVFGIYHLANALRSAPSFAALLKGKTVIPALSERFVGLGGVGMKADRKAWLGHDYSHHSRAFQHVILAKAPFVDAKAFAQVSRDFKAYVHRMISYGNNGIIMPGFLEFINFDKVEGGAAIYGPKSVYRRRHLALRKAFGGLIEYARSMGMKVVLKTDMLALSGPLKAYLLRRFGAIDVSKPALWKVYEAGFEELFRVFPGLHGVMLRIGEAGAVYNHPGWDYTSALYVRTDAAVRAMLGAFLRVARRHKKKILFRTWSVGVGQVGNLHTVSSTYRRVLGPIKAPELVVSTKYVMGDFDSYLPLNPTLSQGEHKRIVEYQARREFEAFNTFPNFVGALHQASLRAFLQKNSKIAGFWTWTQSGGPHRVGPMALYPFSGFWQMTDANVFATSRLGWDPRVDMGEVLRSWASLQVSQGDSPALVEIMRRSRAAVLKGFYIGPYARKQVFALGLEPPPMMWIFKWDIVTGASAPLSIIYLLCRDQLEAAIGEGYEAVKIVEAMQRLAATMKPVTPAHKRFVSALKRALEYERDLFLTLARYREVFLRYYRWLDGGGGASWERWQGALSRFEVAKSAHLKRYASSVEHRAYSFFAADAGLAHARRSRWLAWCARAWLAFVLGLLALALLGGPHSLRLWLAPWQAQTLQGGQSARLWLAAMVLGIVLGLAIASSFVAWRFGLWMSCSVLGWAALFVAAHGWSGARWEPLAFATFGPILGVLASFLLVMAVRGPVGFSFWFWGSTGFRVVWVVAFVVAFCWVWFAAFCASSALGSRLSQRCGAALLACGAVWLATGLLGWGFGLERCLTALNDELAVLPLGLSRILGITTHLNIPLEIPLWLCALGAGAAGLGAVLSRYSRPSHR